MGNKKTRTLINSFEAVIGSALLLLGASQPVNAYHKIAEYKDLQEAILINEFQPKDYKKIDEDLSEGYNMFMSDGWVKVNNSSGNSWEISLKEMELNLLECGREDAQEEYFNLERKKDDAKIAAGCGAFVMCFGGIAAAHGVSDYIKSKKEEKEM